MERPPVTLVSNIPHSVHAAKALSNAGLLRAYVGPILLEESREWGRLDAVKTFQRLVEKRSFQGVDALPLRRLVVGEPIHRASGKVFSKNVTRSISRLIYNAEISLRLRRVDSPIVHYHSTTLTWSLNRHLRNNSLLICDHRALHPRDEIEYSDRPGWRRDLEREFELSDIVLVNSAAAASSLMNHGVPEQKITVIPLGVDLRLFRPMQAPAKSRRGAGLRVLCAGDMTERKGLTVILEALAPIAKDLEVTFAGRAPTPSVRRTLQRLPSSKVLGPISQRELRDQYHAADLLILASHREAFGLVAAEAMACGIPVVVSDGCGVADLVTPGVSGLIFQNGSADNLRSNIELLMQSPEQRLRMGTSAARSIKEWDWQRYGARLTEFYERLLDVGDRQ